jgi:hypothetical protein
MQENKDKNTSTDEVQSTRQHIKNPAGGVDASLLCVLRVVSYRSLRRADPSSRGVLPNVVSLCVIKKPQE